jgi:hypothetical protein
LAFAFTSSPAIISAFAGSKAAEGFLANVNWRWGYGVWAIILPAFALPIYFMLAYNLRRAEREGILVRERKAWNFNFETIWWFMKEFDCESPYWRFVTMLILFSTNSNGCFPIR